MSDPPQNVLPDFDRLLVTPLAEAINNVLSKVSEFNTKSSLLSLIIGSRLCQCCSVSTEISELFVVIQKMSEKQKDSLNMLGRWAFLDYVDKSILPQQLSNELLRNGFERMADVLQLGMIDCVTKKVESFEYSTPTDLYRFHHFVIQEYCAALHLVQLPLMSALKFATSQLFSLPSNKWGILEAYFGLAKSKMSPVAKESLFYILQYVCRSFTGSHPFLDNPVVLLVLRCLFEAHDVDLCLQVHHELLLSQTFSFKLPALKTSTRALSYYLSNSVPEDTIWRVYCSDEKLVKELVMYVTKYSSRRRTQPIVVRVDEQIIYGDPERIVISLRSRDYLLSTLPQYLFLHPKPSTEFASSDSSLVITPEKMTDTLPIVSSEPNNMSLLPYGYVTKEQLETRKQVENAVYYPMVKDLMVPLVQPYCPTVVVQSQYRKGDHIWLSCSRNIRHDFYENVQISPISPLHWVKVKQPDGTLEMEERYKSFAMDQLQGSSTSSTDIAEIVLLNSHRYTRIAVTPLVGKDHVNNILLYENSEEVDEPGHIGCDFLKDEYLIQEDVRWRGIRHFDILADEQIGRELPLPSKRGTESGDMTAITAAGHATSDDTMRPQVQPLPHMTPSPRPLSLQPPLPTSYENVLGTTTSVGSVRRLGDERPSVSDQQIKRWALEAYDQPGQCFYGDDSNRFEVGRDYTLPDQLPHSRVLREGGNGLILEVYFEGVLYAVKRTAFRWREVLIMPKLRHPNILRLSAMLMGMPIEGYPRRRHVFHFYPRMTNDLGRMVGSYEKYCLRTLKERYRNEPLLLSKIHSNFRFITREILQGLHYLHTLPNPIVHRDVKPSNILVLTECDCSNPLACVCRKRPRIVLSDFDASLELNSDGTLQPDPARNTLQGFYTSSDRTYHISPVGTIGFKSPEGYIHMIGNNADVMPPLTTKADIFSFGLVMSLLLMNEEGPKYLSQMGVLLLAMNQRTGPRSSKVSRSVLSQVTVTSNDIHRVLPIGRFRKEFNDIPSLITFMMRCLEVDPRKRASAYELLVELIFESCLLSICDKVKSCYLNQMSNQQHTCPDKCSSPVNMDDIVLSATVNILGNEGDAIVPSLSYYDVTTEQATEDMLFDFESKSNEGDAIVPSLSYYDVTTEQATEEMLFDFGTTRVLSVHSVLFMAAYFKSESLGFRSKEPPKTMPSTNGCNEKEDNIPIISSPTQVEEINGNYAFVGGGKIIIKPPGWKN